MNESGRWRVVKQCVNCPFHKTGPGARLRQGLRRWREIVRGLKNRETFFCHETTSGYEDREEANGGGTIADLLAHKGMVCAGAIEFYRKNKCVPRFVQMMERSDAQHRAKKCG